MSEKFSGYTAEYISGLMSLRKPQRKSLVILDEILSRIKLQKEMNLSEALETVKAIYPTCKNFERDFMSLTFALATGVGKTRLMGAFMAYLFTRHDIRNFFVVAPNTTIYEKIRHDLTEQASDKYIFKGLGCFDITPAIFTEDDYRMRNITLYDEAGIKIYLYNIDKFNKENARMRRINEILGESFYNYLSDLPDLVLIMDESHHYRAERGAAALNELSPVLGLELTATPVVNKGSRQIKFENVVYEYPLSEAINDGYTRTPYAMARANINFRDFGEERLDKIILDDAVKYHEKVKLHLIIYADTQNKKLVKPFMLVVCRDTEHAARIEKYINSKDFRDGNYINKVIRIDSKQKKSESSENIKKLQSVEDPENPIEIVIHVNMLKEGWDVNNLYTIVPLRTAASKILREQMVGRGLRLPYGERTGDKDIDAVMLTAHENFNELIEEAQNGESIFKRGHIIDAEEIEHEQTSSSQLSVNFNPDTEREEAYKFTGLEKNEETDLIFDKTGEIIKREISTVIQTSKEHKVTPEHVKKIAKKVSEEISADDKLQKTYKNNEEILEDWNLHVTEKYHAAMQKKFIPIPIIKTVHAGEDELNFADFDLDLTCFNYANITDEIVIQDLTDPRQREKMKAAAPDLSDFNPVKFLLDALKEQPEIDYGKCSNLLFKLINQLCVFYGNKYGSDGMKKIIMKNHLDIINKIYEQMLKHVERKEGYTFQEITGMRNYNLESKNTYEQQVDLFENFTGNIKSVLFTGIKRGVFDSAKFDSRQGELTLAKLMETDNDIESWLRPDMKEFDIRYKFNETEHKYYPDFLASTEKTIYMIEVKAEKDQYAPDVEEKKKAGIKFCQSVSAWGIENGAKAWKYLFIPAKQINATTSFRQLAESYVL